MQIRNSIIWAMTFMMSLNISAQSPKTECHIVQAGETLYSIARHYEVKVDDIININPGLQAEKIISGQTIMIPSKGDGRVSSSNAVPAKPGDGAGSSDKSASHLLTGHDGLSKYKTKHEVKKKETVYSISKMYGLTEKELIDANPELKSKKLKKGSIINIPYSDAELQQMAAEKKRAESIARMEWEKKHGAVKVAVILPFDAASNGQSAESRKMTNLYQGFLLAVDSLKQKGMSVDVYAYDEAASYSSVDRVLGKAEMKDMNLIIGPIRQWNIKAVADYAQANGIIHVVPLSNESALSNDRPNTFQINISTNQLYNQVYNKFYAEHMNDNIILVNCGTGDENADFIKGLKQSLKDKGITYSISSVNKPDELHSMMIENKQNVLVPTCSNAKAFTTLCSRLDAMHLAKTHKLQLFGYPEWQTFTGNNEVLMSKYNAQFFTTFFSNEESARTQRFNSNFRKWFKQDQYKSIPRYGELGFDIGAYFIKGIKEFRGDFMSNIHNFSYSSLEFPFNFEKKDSQSGFQNRSILFITKSSSGKTTIR